MSKSVDEKLFIACDHAGLELKTRLMQELGSKSGWVDLGTHTLESVNYPDYAMLLAQQVLINPHSRGILICGSGIGMSIMANKFQGIRAALCYSEETGRLAAEHNNANILCLGARTTSWENNLNSIHGWLNGKFMAGRHEIRVNMMNRWGSLMV